MRSAVAITVTALGAMLPSAHAVVLNPHGTCIQNSDASSCQ
jgi:hypothetical protein